MQNIRRFLAEQRGQDLVEYSLLLAAVALACLASIYSVGGDIGQLWTIFNSRMSGS